MTHGVTIGDGHGIEELLGAGSSRRSCCSAACPTSRSSSTATAASSTRTARPPASPWSARRCSTTTSAPRPRRGCAPPSTRSSRPASRCPTRSRSTRCDDEPVWYVSRWSPIEREGEVVAGLIVASDITRRVMLERLDMAEQEAILDSAAEGILGLDEEGNVTFANTAAPDLLGTRRGRIDAAATSTTSCTPPRPSRPRTTVGECPVLLSITHGIVQHMEDDVFWRADGSSFPVNYTSSPIVEGDELRAPCSRSTTSPSASASRPSFSTWPTTTPSPASTTGAGSSRSSRATSPTTRATARAAPCWRSTSTTSSTSTTRSATRPATR